MLLIRDFNNAFLNALYRFRQGSDKDNADRLISSLEDLERIARTHIADLDLESDKGLWFRFFHGDTLATTIADIKRTLELPWRHGNYMSMIENFDIALREEEVEIYYS